MTGSYIETVQEIFSDVGSLNEEKVESFVAETAAYLKDLQERLASEDESVRQNAMKAAMEVQAGLGKQVEAILQTVGINASELSRLAEISMSEEQKEIIKKAEKRLSFPEEKVEKQESRPLSKRKSNKIKLVG